MDVFRKVIGSSVTRQGFGYAAASLVASSVGGAVTVLLARQLGADRFAVYSFSKSMLMFTTLFFEFGLMVPVARRVATARADQLGDVLGAGTIVALSLAMAFSLAIFIASFFVDDFFSVPAGPTLRAVAVLAAGWPLAESTFLMAQGAERIGMYAGFSLSSRVAWMLVFLWLTVSGGLSPTSALFCESALLLAGWCLVIWRMHPTFGRVRTLVRSFGAEAREYGWAIYVGRVLSTGTYNMDVLMLGAMAGTHDVAYYTLAGAIAGFVTLVPYGLCAALFNRMTKSTALRPGWRWATSGTSLGGALLTTALTVPFVHLVLGPRYDRVIPLAFVLAGAMAIGGMTRLYNAFLTAQGLGRDLRTAACALTASNVVLNLALIPPFGALGAAWASAIALLINLVVHVARYRRYVGRLPSRQPTVPPVRESFVPPADAQVAP